MNEENPYKTVASGIGFSNPYTAENLSASERQEQYVAEQMQAQVEKVDSNDYGVEDLEMVARSFIDGLWLNKSEEVGSYLAALAVKALNPDLVADKKISEIASEMLTDLEAESAQFAEDRPVLSAVSNIAGGVLSPVSLAGGQVISKASQIRGAGQAAQASDEVAATLGSQFGRTPASAELAEQLTRQAYGRVPQIVSKVPTPVAASGFAGAEGLVIGAEGESLEDRAINGLITAGVSATVPFAFAGIKKGYDLVTKPNISQELGEGADFVNLMFTDHKASNIYRSVVSKAYGGRSLTEQQARKMFARTPSTKAAQEAAKQIKENAARKTALATRSIQEGKEESLAAAERLREEAIAEAKKDLAYATGQERTRIQKVIQELEEAKDSAGTLRAIAVKEADAAVNAADGTFRGQVIASSVPANAPADEVAALGMLDPQDANAALDSIWKQYGFKVADNKRYELDFDAIEGVIDQASKKYRELALVEGGGIVGRVKQYVTESLKDIAEDGVISGRDLVQLRSDIGRAINGLSDNKVSTRGFASQIQDYFDDVLESGLSKSEIEQFAEDRFNWSIRSSVDSAIEKASGGSAKAGAFTASEFLDVLKSNSGRFAARGQARFQKEAQEIVKLSEKNKKNIIDLANKEADDIVKSTKQKLTNQRIALEETKASLKKQALEAEKAAKARYGTQKLTAEQRATRDIEIQEIKERFNLQLADVDSQINEAQQKMKAIAEMAPSSFKSSVFENLFNTSLLGQAATVGQTGIKESLILGGIGARLLSAETAQRLLAGQTKGQAALRGRVSSVADRLSRASTIPGINIRGNLPSEEIATQTVSPTTVSAGVGATTEQVVNPQGVMFSEERKKLVRNLPVSGKAALFRNLEANGRLDRLKAEDPALYRELEKASKK